jgi:putative ABC transport system permease protein
MRDGAGAPNFKLADAQAIQAQVNGIEAVAPSIGRAVTLVRMARNWSTSVTGTTNAFFPTGNWSLAEGRYFTEPEERAGKSVCVIGETVRRELFGNQSPVGGEIRIKQFSCEVIGLLAPKGQSSFGADQDDAVIMPLRTVQRRLTGNQDVNTIRVSVRDGVSIERTMATIRELMRERRKISENEEDNFSVLDTRQIAEALSSTTRVMTMLLGAVAAVSLLVGGIGIMNVMLVAVTERTREIGIRLAVGAQQSDVLLQFLVEAVVLSLVGGITGATLGFLGAMAIGGAIGVPIFVTFEVVALGFGVPTLIGIAFGFFPALRASRLDPIEALRYE